MHGGRVVVPLAGVVRLEEKAYFITYYYQYAVISCAIYITPQIANYAPARERFIF